MFAARTAEFLHSSQVASAHDDSRQKLGEHETPVIHDAAVFQRESVVTT